MKSGEQCRAGTGRVRGQRMETTQKNFRKVLRVQAKATAPNGAALLGKTLDISPKGMSILLSDAVQVRQHYHLAFDTFIAGSARAFRLDGKVAYCVLSGSQGFRVGFEFDHVTPELQSLIEAIA